jgi:large subunit ribosomal protein L31
MQTEIQPQSQEIKATCTCGHSFNVVSTLKEDIHLDICSKCHPFYTGQQKIIDTAGQVERFRRKYGKRSLVDRAKKDSES